MPASLADRRTAKVRPADARYVSKIEPGGLITSPDGVSASGLWTVARTLPIDPPSKIISRFPSGHAWTGGTADDTGVHLYTDRTYKATTNGTGTAKFMTSPTFTAVDFSSSVIRVVFKVDDASKLHATTPVCLQAITTAGNVFQAFPIKANIISGEWCVATINRSQFTVAAGSPTWSSITQVVVRVQDASAGAVNLYLAAFELVPDMAAAYPNGVMVCELDDGFASQLSLAAPIFAQRGIPVTYSIIVERFLGGSPPSGITPAQLRVLQDKYGWQISCHSYSQTVHDAVGASAATLEADWQREKHWLHANGLHSGVDHYALCPATGAPVAEGAVMDALRRNFRSVRTNFGFYETVRPADPLRLRSNLYSNQTVAQMQTNIAAQAGAGGVLHWTWHEIIAGAVDGTVGGLGAQGATNLATILDYAQTTKGMAFRTRADWLDGR